MNRSAAKELPAQTRLARGVRAAGTALLLLLALSVPAVYRTFGIRGITAGLEAEVLLLTQEVERIVQDRPELWEYETLRLREIAGKRRIDGAPSRRQILDREGRLLAEEGIPPPSPSLRIERPVYDSGQVVARFVVERSYRGLEVRAATVGITALALALIGAWLLRSMPYRLIGQLVRQLASERLRSERILESLQEGVVAVDGNGQVVLMNPAARELLGSEGSVEALRIPAGQDRSKAEGPGVLTLGGQDGGSKRILEFQGFPVLDPDGGAEGEVFLIRDATARLQAEAESLRARQIESLGVVAGGIAHDFNNFLTAILGNLTLLRNQVGREPKLDDLLEQAIQGARRAHGVSSRLLSFAKGGEHSARSVLDLPALILESTRFALLGDGIECSFDFPPGLAHVEGDAGQLAQVFHNLAINAKQAMGSRGRISVRASHRMVKEGNVPHLDPGPYVMVQFSDSGAGIPKEIRDRIFDPYFTTKPTGSGLGLATAYRIMKSHGGNIFVETPAEGGASFSLYFKASRARAEAAHPDAEPALDGRGERILVMDDDPIILSTCKGILEHSGFEVTGVPEGRRAASVYMEAVESGCPFRAAVLDLTVPGGLGGAEAAKLILARDPGARLLASSGYNEDPVMARPSQFGFRSALAKPYAAEELVRAVASVLAVPEQQP